MRPLHYIFIFIILTIASGGSLYWFLRHSHETNKELRASATPYLRALDASDFSADIENRGTDLRIWGMRAKAQKTLFSPQFVSAVQFLQDVPFLANSTLTESKIQQNETASLNNSALSAPLFFHDNAISHKDYAVLPVGWQDTLDVEAHPVRWRLARPLLANFGGIRAKESSIAENAKAAIAKIRREPKISPAARAEHYRALVNSFARRYNLSTDLVMAIIHSESDFTPTLVSNKSAMGLMQLLPSTASGEVHRFLYGRRGQVSFEQLRIPEINIRYGTAYLHILLNRYFPNIKNRSVQEACAIAAYNMGPNRFIRLYGSTNDAAIAKINSMDEETFFADLLKRLPVRETRIYVEKVRRMKKHYSSLP